MCVFLCVCFLFFGGGLSVLLLPSRLLCTHPSPSPVRLRWPPGSSALTTWTSVPKVCIYVHAQLTINDSNSAMSAHISLFCSCLYVIRNPPPHPPHTHTHSLWFSPSLSLLPLTVSLLLSRHRAVWVWGSVARAESPAEEYGSSTPHLFCTCYQCPAGLIFYSTTA